MSKYNKRHKKKEESTSPLPALIDVNFTNPSILRGKDDDIPVELHHNMTMKGLEDVTHRQQDQKAYRESCDFSQDEKYDDVADMSDDPSHITDMVEDLNNTLKFTSKPDADQFNYKSSNDPGAFANLEDHQFVNHKVAGLDMIAQIMKHRPSKSPFD